MFVLKIYFPLINHLAKYNNAGVDYLLKDNLSNNQINNYSPKLVANNYLASIKSPASELLLLSNKIEKERFTLSKQVLTYPEYLEEVINDPKKYLRSPIQYIIDALDYWNKAKGIKDNATLDTLGHTVKPFAFAKRPWESDLITNKTGVCGQELAINELYSNFIANKNKKPDKMIILHGPNGSGKNRIIETVYEALQHYSETNEGTLYTFNWVFNDKENDDSFDSVFPVYSGPNAIKKQNDNFSTSKTSVTIPASLNTNPIYLLSKEARLKLIDILQKNQKLPIDLSKDDLILEGLDSSSQKIFDALWKMYNGDINKLLSHVQVTRWTLSEQNRRGLVTIPPEQTHEAQLIPITPEIDWNSLPVKIKEAFRASGLHEITGAFPQANRGSIHFEDMFKTPDIGRYLPLLRTIEKNRTTVTSGMGNKSVDERLNLLFLGTTNDINLYNLQKNYADWDSLKERFTLIPVGYERRYKSVTDIYKDQLKQLIPENSGRHIAPNTLNTFGLWTTMTYLFPPTNERYYEAVDRDIKKPLRTAVTRLDPLNKALLYQGEELDLYELDPKKHKFNVEEKTVLKSHLKDIADEFNLGLGKQKFLFYEGGTGISPRDARKLLEETVKAKPNECFSVLELFDVVEEWIKNGLGYEDERVNYARSIRQAADQASKLRQNIVLPSIPEFQPAHKLLIYAKIHARRKIKYDLQDALGFIKPMNEHIKILRKYIEHVKAFRSKQDVLPEWQEPGSLQPSEKFMASVEKILNPVEMMTQDSEIAKNAFRKRIVETYGQWRGEHPDENPMENLERIFSDLVFKMKSKDVEDNKQKLYTFLFDLKKNYEPKNRDSIQDLSNKERLDLLNNGLQALKSSGYCDKCIPKLLDFAFHDDEEYRAAMQTLQK